MPVSGRFLTSPRNSWNISRHVAAILFIFHAKPLLEFLLFEQDDHVHDRQHQQESDIHGQIVGKQGIAEDPQDSLDVSRMTDARIGAFGEKNPFPTAREFGYTD